MLKQIPLGMKYATLMPYEKKLHSFFPDLKWIIMVRSAEKIFPAGACVLFVWFFIVRINEHYLIHASLSALVLLSGLFQGYFFLGMRANAPLPQHFVAWYHELEQKLRMSNNAKNVPPMTAYPRFIDLALLLNLAQQTFGQEYFDNL